MYGRSPRHEQTLLAVAIACAGLVPVSIAASQILLGLGIVLTLYFERKLSFPRIWIPLLLSFIWTLAADILCPDPWTGRAQLKKYFVWMLLPVLYGVFKGQLESARILLAIWIATSAASGALGLYQFAHKYQIARRSGQDFYIAYLGDRITGFESHWMTFGALQLAVLSLTLAHLFFAAQRLPRWVYASVGIFSAAILLGWTRSIWLAAVPSLLYLVWCWRPKMTLAVPVLILAIFTVAPAQTRARLFSLIHPHGDTDSNSHRVVTFRTGLAMIEAHPWFGLGPEEIGRQFDAYVPLDIGRPLPTGYYGHLHNIYVQYAAERGIPGLVLVLSVIGSALWTCLSAIRKIGRRRSSELFLLHGTVAVIIGILVGGLFEYNLGDSEVLMMFVSVLALGLAAAQRINSRLPEMPSLDGYPSSPALTGNVAV